MLHFTKGFNIIFKLVIVLILLVCLCLILAEQLIWLVILSLLTFFINHLSFFINHLSFMIVGWSDIYLMDLFTIIIITVYAVAWFEIKSSIWLFEVKSSIWLLISKSFWVLDSILADNWLTIFEKFSAFYLQSRFFINFVWASTFLFYLPWISLLLKFGQCLTITRFKFIPNCHFSTLHHQFIVIHIHERTLSIYLSWNFVLAFIILFFGINQLHELILLVLRFLFTNDTNYIWILLRRLLFSAILLQFMLFFAFFWRLDPVIFNVYFK